MSSNIKLAQIESGIVVNAIMVDPDNIPDFCADWPEITEGGKGWSFDGNSFTAPAVDPAEALAAKRAGMTCSKMQGILTLGEAKWGEVMAYRDTASWAEQMVIDSATDWHRNSQNIQFIGYLVGYTDAEMDDLFIAAASVEG
tara:strand:- start:7473 stop:7898 length:426 start_codon:yes stop_codon:yes gene_type:complete